MKYFEVQIKAKGKKNLVTVKAEDKLEAMEYVKAKHKGILLKINEVPAPLSDKIDAIKTSILTSFTRKEVNQESWIAIVRQMAVMSDAGIAFDEILGESAKATEDPQLKRIMTKVSEDIAAGINFSNAVKAFDRELGALTNSMISIGEQTGNMAEAFGFLAEILGEMHENKKKLKKAMKGPRNTMIAMGVAFSTLIMMVVPKFQSVFNKLGAELPMPTIILIKANYIFENFMAYIIAGIVVSIFTLNMVHRNNAAFRLQWDRYILNMPVVGKLKFMGFLSRFMIVFSSLLKAGIPIVDALETSIGIVENDYLKQKFNSIIINVQNGASLTQAIKETKLFESMIIQMISAGESSGSLEKMLDKVAEYYRGKFRDMVDNINTMIEPIMMAGIAGLVLLLALGIFLPMWSLGEAAKG